jgi:hypothetical protein
MWTLCGLAFQAVRSVATGHDACGMRAGCLQVSLFCTLLLSEAQEFAGQTHVVAG